MAGQEKRVPDLPVVNTVASSDRVVVVANAAGNSATSLIPVANLPVIAVGPTPANSNSIADLTPGTIWTDNTSIYWVIGSGAILKVPGSTF